MPSLMSLLARGKLTPFLVIRGGSRGHSPAYGTPRETLVTKPPPLNTVPPPRREDAAEGPAESDRPAKQVGYLRFSFVHFKIIRHSFP
jgi:hypothetical protein